LKAKLYKVLDQYHLYNGDKAIATTILGNPMLLPNLSKQNCDEIFGIIDVEKLADEYLEKHFSTGLDTNYIQNIVSDGIKYGFKKAMELNNKVFTLEDVILIAEYVRVASQSTPNERTKNLVNEYLSTQPTEIDVEIVTESMNIDEIKKQEQGFLNANLNKPKLDAEGEIILKRI
jgi:hypothetical protein